MYIFFVTNVFTDTVWYRGSSLPWNMNKCAGISLWIISFEVVWELLVLAINFLTFAKFSNGLGPDYEKSQILNLRFFSLTVKSFLSNLLQILAIVTCYGYVSINLIGWEWFLNCRKFHLGHGVVFFTVNVDGPLSRFKKQTVIT